jgi:FkbM family methyltransferase
MNLIIEFIINQLSKYHYFKINNYLKILKLKNIVDVGAHKGEFFQYFAKKNNFINKALLVEPQTNIFNILKRLVNKIDKKIIIKNIALGDKSGKQKLFYNSLSSTSTLKKYNQYSYWYKFKQFVTFNFRKKNPPFFLVKIETLDNLLKNTKFSRVDLLKIDTEGFELEVLQGAQKSMKNIIKYILLERTFTKIYKDYSFKKIENILRINNYVLIKKFKFIIPYFEDRLYKKINEK